MALQLSGAQRGELRTALLEAFTFTTLPQMFTERLEKPFFNYAPPHADFPEMVFQAISAAIREGWIDKLITKSIETVPGNPKLSEFCSKLGMLSFRMDEGAALESVIRKDLPYLDIHPWVARLSELEHQVCRVEIPTSQNATVFGTGFLVAPGRVMTNYHVVEVVAKGEAGQKTAEGLGARASDVRCRFDYKVIQQNVLNDGTVYSLENAWLADSSPCGAPESENLDYAILRLAEDPGDAPVATDSANHGSKRGLVKLPAADPEFSKGMPILILQHPQRGPLKLAFGGKGAVDLNAGRSRITYGTNTETGSSGAPCFNQALEPVALHHAGDPNFGPLPEINVGIPLSTIRKMIDRHGAGRELG